MQTPRNTGSTPLRARRIARVITALGRAAVAGSLASIMACADTPSAILAPPDVTPASHAVSTTTLATTSTTTRVSGLLREVPLLTAQTRSWVIQSALGGELKWDELGLKVTVPPGAFSAPEMTFTVTALPGSVIAYDFGPDGSQFNVPLQFTQSLKGVKVPKEQIDNRTFQLRGAYFRHASQVSGLTGTATVDEFLPIEFDFKTWRLKFKIKHFSGYMVSTD